MNYEGLPTTKRQISIMIRDYGGERRKRSMSEKKQILNDIIENKKLGDRELTDEEVDFLEEVFRKYLTGRWLRTISQDEFLSYINEKGGEVSRFDAAKDLGCSDELARIRLNELADENKIHKIEKYTGMQGAPSVVYIKKMN